MERFLVGNQVVRESCQAAEHCSVGLGEQHIVHKCSTFKMANCLKFETGLTSHYLSKTVEESPKEIFGILESLADMNPNRFRDPLCDE